MPIRTLTKQCHVVLISILSVLGINNATAQDNSITQPMPLEKVAPEAPVAKFGPSPEGWMKVRYSILKDGSTANIQILNVMPPKLSTIDAVKAIQAWTFTPAMNNDKAIDWHNNVEYVVFDSELTPENTPGFMIAADYERVQKYLDNEKYKQAKNRAEKMIRGSLFSLYDIGLANMQLASIELKLENYYAAYNAIRNATPSEAPMLTVEELETALQYRFSIALALGQLTDALSTYERYVELFPLPAGHRMTSQSEAIRTALAGNEALAIRASVNDKVWNYVPSGRTFAIADVDGQIDSIEVICNRGITTLEFEADLEWALPASWGDCSLDVQGKNDTTFTFYEL